jgi:hypothetical protein
VLSALWEKFGNGVIQRVPYGDTAGFRSIAGEVVVLTGSKRINVEELIDNRFVKELEDNAFVKSLYGGK